MRLLTPLLLVLLMGQGCSTPADPQPEHPPAAATSRPSHHARARRLCEQSEAEVVMLRKVWDHSLVPRCTVGGAGEPPPQSFFLARIQETKQTLGQVELFLVGEPELLRWFQVNVREPLLALEKEIVSKQE